VTEPIAAGTPYVFVCYSHDQRETVRAQIDWLRAQGFTVWYDEAIQPGSRWTEDLASAVDGCAAFLFFLCPRSVGSRHCLDEVHFALECGRPIVPVELAPVTLTPGLRLSIGGTHRIAMHQMQPREFRHKLLSGLRDAVQNPARAHPIEQRAADTAPLPFKSQAVANSRPAMFGVLAALATFVAMLVVGR
jgi:hypothetical protein